MSEWPLRAHACCWEDETISFDVTENRKHWVVVNSGGEITKGGMFPLTMPLFGIESNSSSELREEAGMSTTALLKDGLKKGGKRLIAMTEGAHCYREQESSFPLSVKK